ncbi:MAG: hypothetical protein KU37_03175 [Sulfuricurvum sp. PC08-66]|nr:MAG: hypothetical protein KU37_03175 [Sulfuricurvum sp. PC08-66]
MKRKIVGAMVALAAVLGGCASKNYAPLETVAEVDLTRYVGQWYEIARYPNSFERDCMGATAFYTAIEGAIEVKNSCFDTQGAQISQSVGEALIVEKSANTKLRVSFFWPFYGDYWVLMLDENYRYAVVGEPSRKYFWILARDKALLESEKEAILAKMPSLGYEPAKLFWNSYN